MVARSSPRKQIMRRALWIAPLVVAAGVAGVLVLRSPSAAEAGRASDSGPATLPAPELRVSRAVLFSSGVGYFQREGEVEGSTHVNLSFPVQDINDLLKSMVLQDLGGGQITAVNYDSHDPVEKTLKSFAVNLTSNPTFAQLLDQARGEKVGVLLQQSDATQAGTLNGTVIGMEQKQQKGKDGVATVEMLNLWCKDGLHSIRLADVQRVQFTNPVMEREFKQALDVLALSHDRQKKTVSLAFTGEGKRRVRVGYVVENPIWKTSYRLVLDKDGKALLQGWAVVENPTDEDWNNCRMTLVSGRPISFRMDLYQPLYVQRPVVEPELFASLRPTTYGGAMPTNGPAASYGVDLLEHKLADVAQDGQDKAGKPVGAGGLGLGNLRGEGKPPAWGRGLGLGRANGEADQEQAKAIARSVASAASASQLGDFFQYAIDHPVSLPRQKSALLPIVSQDITGTRVSIYNEGVHAKFPMLGLRFKNTTGLHLMQGPITVFDGDSYAGDSRTLDVQPKEERLLSFAIDLGMEVEPVRKDDSGRLTAVKVYKGILQATTRLREGKRYNVVNRTDKGRTLLVEHPYRSNFHLTSKGKPAERTREVYRFQLKVPAGKGAHLDVVEETDLRQDYSLSNVDDQTVRVFLQSPATSTKVKEALAEAMKLKATVAATQAELARRRGQLKEVVEDQARMRANVRDLPEKAPVYKRYLEKFDKQEAEIEALQKQIKDLEAAELRHRNDYDAYLAGLTVE
jgi:hypothetical protein